MQHPSTFTAGKVYAHQRCIALSAFLVFLPISTEAPHSRPLIRDNVGAIWLQLNTFRVKIILIVSVRHSWKAYVNTLPCSGTKLRYDDCYTIALDNGLISEYFKVTQVPALNGTDDKMKVNTGCNESWFVFIKDPST
jgi:hypothetical protein